MFVFGAVFGCVVHVSLDGRKPCVFPCCLGLLSLAPHGFSCIAWQPRNGIMVSEKEDLGIWKGLVIVVKRCKKLVSFKT